MNDQNFSEEELNEIKNIKVGKWDIISEYHRLDWLKKGYSEEESKIHGIVIAIVGYRARTGKGKESFPKLERKGGEVGVSITHRNKEKWITPQEFDKIIKKMGEEYYKKVFSPAIKKLYDQGYSYDKVKETVSIPSTIGAKITLDQFIPILKK